MTADICDTRVLSLHSRHAHCAVRGLLLACVLAAPPATAQQVLQATADYQPLTYTDANGYRGCGIRATVLYTETGGRVAGADISVNLFQRPQTATMYKVAALTVVGVPPDFKMTRQAPTRFYVSLEKTGRPVRMGDPVKSDQDPGYVFAAAASTDTLDVLQAMFSGERLVLSLVLLGSTSERRYVFASQLSDADLQSFAACFTALSAE